MAGTLESRLRGVEQITADICTDYSSLTLANLHIAGLLLLLTVDRYRSISALEHHSKAAVVD